MAIAVKFVGVLRHVLGVNELALDLSSCRSLRGLLDELVREKPKFESILIDRQLKDPRLNALVLVNGREISVLKGLDTTLDDGDEIVFIPVVHGG